jgi:hypothetical protein
VADEEPKEKTPRPTKMELLDPTISKEVDDMILKGFKGIRILERLKDITKGSNKLLPERHTIDRHAARRYPFLKKRHDDAEKAKDALSKTDKTMSQIHSQINLAVIDPTQHKDLLITLQSHLLQRIEFIKMIQDEALDPKWEKSITENTVSVQKITELMLKMEGKLGGSEISQMILFVLMDRLIPVVGQAYEETNSRDRLQLFVENLKRRIKNVDIKSIKDEAEVRLSTEQVKLLEQGRS